MRYLKPFDYEDLVQLEKYKKSFRKSELDDAKHWLGRELLDLGLESAFNAFYVCGFAPHLHYARLGVPGSLWELTFRVDFTLTEFLFCC